MPIRSPVARATGAMVLVAVVLLAAAGPGAVSRQAGAARFYGFDPDDNTITVEKALDGVAPEGATFEVEVSCTSLDTVRPDADLGPFIIRFDGAGVPVDDATFSVGPGYECVAIETVTGGAVVSYGCAVVGPDDGGVRPGDDTSAPMSCTDGQTVVFDGVVGVQATISVTNTFGSAPPETAPAGLVAARPSFTG